MLRHFVQQLHMDGSVTLILRIHPGAQKTTITGVMDDGTIKIDVRAAAERGKANEELIRFLARGFNVPRAQVKMIAGMNSRKKIMKIANPD